MLVTIKYDINHCDLICFRGPSKKSKRTLSEPTSRDREDIFTLHNISVSIIKGRLMRGGVLSSHKNAILCCFHVFYAFFESNQIRVNSRGYSVGSYMESHKSRIIKGTLHGSQIINHKWLIHRWEPEKLK